MPRYQYTKLLEVDARGGYSQDNINADPRLSSTAHTPTRAGRFIVKTVEKHVSGSRWLYSIIPWGTPMRLDGDAVRVKMNGIWKKLSDTDKRWLAGYKKMKGKDPEQMLLDYIRDKWKQVEGAYGSVPNAWVWNDFGHMSVKYFRDNNHNGVFDQKTDELMSDFIHTTPNDEAITAYNKLNARSEVINLSASHGCIHIKPDDIDKMIHIGYLHKGAVLEVHPYAATHRIPASFTSDKGSDSNELHFYPVSSTDVTNVDGGGKLVVYRVKKIS